MPGHTNEKSSLEFGRLRILSVFLLSALCFYVLSNYTSSGICYPFGKVLRFVLLLFLRRFCPVVGLGTLCILRHVALAAMPEGNFSRKECSKVCPHLPPSAIICGVGSSDGGSANLHKRKTFREIGSHENENCLFPTTDFRFDPNRKYFHSLV